jgi:hypothetical protein
MQKYLLTVSFIILIMPCYLSAHWEPTHQYVVVEGYKLLKNQLGDIPEMKDYIGTTQGRGNLQFQVPYVVGGAWAEDQSDAVYGIGYRESLVAPIAGFTAALISTLLGAPYLIPLEIAGAVYGDPYAKKSLISVTHFWNADKGDDSLLIHSHTENDIYASKKRIVFHLKVGFKSLEDGGIPGTKNGWSMGIGLQLPLGEHWDLNGVFTYWRSRSNFQLVEENVNLTDYSILVSYRHKIADNISLFYSLGPGLATSTKTRPENSFLGTKEEHGLVSFNAVVGAQWTISKIVSLVGELQKQMAGSPPPSGGESYSPWLISLGIGIGI